MAVATSIIAAGILAGGALGGAAVASRASNKATKAAAAGNTEALTYTKEQEATRRADFAQAQAAYQRQWEAWNAQRMALLGRYGVNVSGMQAPPLSSSAAAAPAFAGGAAVGGPRAANALGNAALQGQTVADILGRGANLGKWNDWGEYGLRTA